MPDLARFLAWHALVGFGIAIPFVAMLLWLDVGGLGGLIGGSETGIAEAALLTFFVGLTFGSLQMGIAVWQAGGQGPRRPESHAEPPEDDRPLPPD